MQEVNLIVLWKIAKKILIKMAKNMCQKDGKTYRQVIKDFLDDKEKNDKGFKNRLFKA